LAIVCPANAVLAKLPFPSKQGWITVGALLTSNFKQKTALNTPGSTAPTKYAGDPPRVFMNSSQTIYPGATTWVVIYPGNARTTPPTGLAPIPHTSATALLGDMSARLNIYIDSGNYVTGPGSYTLQFMQQSVYGTETFGNPISFWF
jgi:hypothetical protein